ncbi:hypothetical protein PMKS-000660 [Pichia membranifaciens]|uniref:Triosephosphate isomerase n=1 Tax=Pichia membranifaciens TaxID=4926 RepID=A0A1Q2YCB0_9ASCO|nr:hypothetical protein PMKS-000660 [Pichia membranifaciens]
MNGSKESIKTIVENLNSSKLPANVEVVLCPPAPYLAYTADLNKQKTVQRRGIFHESDEFVAEKVAFAIEKGLKVILCIGESIDEKKAGSTLDVCKRELAAVLKTVKKDDWKHIVVAYEPIWAIGTGLAATSADAQDIHSQIRDYLKSEIGELADSVRILYGGSANGKNAPDFKDKPDVDGFLVGGASLKPEFVSIITSRQ